MAISYWESESQIRQWKQDAEHLVAQENGRDKWYRSYRVEGVELVKGGQQREAAGRFLKSQTAYYAGQADAPLRALTDYCHALMGSNEFLYLP